MSRKAIAIFTMGAALVFGIATAEAGSLVPVKPVSKTVPTSLANATQTPIQRFGTLANLDLHVIRSGVGAPPADPATGGIFAGHSDPGGTGTICDFCGHEGGVGQKN